MVADIVAAVALLIWVYLLAARGAFWRADVRDDNDAVPALAQWPDVIAVIPARNEATCIGASVGSLMQQDYPGALSIIVVDDDSSDRTAEIARRAAGERPLEVTRSGMMPPDWTGKVWAMRRGFERAIAGAIAPRYVLFTDADIVHRPDSVRQLVARAERGRTVLTSLMAKLRCVSLAERSHVPAFVYFFQMLFPFAWVNDARRDTPAAAGGCMLVRTDALYAAGGVESIRDALIDDCALARHLKPHGPIWLGLTDRVHSIRQYGIRDVWRMISRSAYAQLNHSPLLLVGTTLGMALTFLAGPLFLVFGDGIARVLGALTTVLMMLSFVPMLRFYQLSPLWVLALPLIALLYMIYTLDSAFQHALGRGGNWKGRVQAGAMRS